MQFLYQVARLPTTGLVISCFPLYLEFDSYGGFGSIPATKLINVRPVSIQKSVVDCYLGLILWSLLLAVTSWRDKIRTTQMKIKDDFI